MKTASSSRLSTVLWPAAAGLLALVVLGGVLGILIWWRLRPPAQQQANPVSVRPPEAIPVPHVGFRDVTDSAGIRFQHTNGAFGEKLLPETMGGGVVVLDYDNDGRQDLLFVNSCFWPGHQTPARRADSGSDDRPTMTLYRNKGDGTFEDVTKAAGLDVTFYGMGGTAGDYDNDGWTDLFLTGVGGNHLFHNEPVDPKDPSRGRHFVEVTEKAGVGGPGGWPRDSQNFLEQESPLNWSTSAAWLDYDGDGRLDLFVCNYVVWSPSNDQRQGFRLEGLGRAYGPPKAFEGSHCFLYRNKGDGTFEDVTVKAGIPVTERGHDVGKSLGVIVCDVDGDGRPDIAVANDTVRNFFFHNKGDGTFEEIGQTSGVAYAEPRARGAMGIDWGEYRPGKFALLIGNFADEPDTFLRLEDRKNLTFFDAAFAEDIARPSRRYLKFGSLFFDYDLDGYQDLLTNDGHLEPDINKVQPAQTYTQPPQLLWNGGSRYRRFATVTPADAGEDLFRPLVGRGCAYLSVAGQGPLDVVLVGNGGPARLLHNEGGTGNHWVRLVLVGDGVHSNRSAIGADITLEAGGVVQHREVASARGYLSQSELPVTFGLGSATKIERVTIRWPGRDGGKPQVLEDVAVDRVHTMRQGEQP